MWIQCMQFRIASAFERISLNVNAEGTHIGRMFYGLNTIRGKCNIPSQQFRMPNAKRCSWNAVCTIPNGTHISQVNFRWNSRISRNSTGIQANSSSKSVLSIERQTPNCECNNFLSIEIITFRFCCKRYSNTCFPAGLLQVCSWKMWLNCIQFVSGRWRLKMFVLSRNITI